MGATPTYHDPRLRTMTDGEIFNTVTHGKATMGAVGPQRAAAHLVGEHVGADEAGQHKGVDGRGVPAFAEQ